jgi:hypothetical protein
LGQEFVEEFPLTTDREMAMLDRFFTFDLQEGNCSFQNLMGFVLMIPKSPNWSLYLILLDKTD